METQFIRLSDSLTVNPAHVAYAERNAQGMIVLHMAVDEPAPASGAREPRLPGHVILVLNARETVSWQETVGGRRGAE
jgi:hypothetical protein